MNSGTLGQYSISANTAKQSAAVLAVPSAVVPAETNYLLNPLHPDFRRIKTGRPQKIETDPRLLKT